MYCQYLDAIVSRIWVEPTATERISAGIGTPDLVVFAKIFRARPCLANPKTVRDAWKSRQLVQLHALVITTALGRSGRNGMSSLFMAMMKDPCCLVDRQTERICIVCSTESN